jgi:hypothetical protein
MDKIRPLKLSVLVEVELDIQLVELKNKLGLTGAHLDLLRTKRKPPAAIAMDANTALSKTLGFIAGRFRQLAETSRPNLIVTVMARLTAGRIKGSDWQEELEKWLERIKARVIKEARELWEHHADWFNEICLTAEINGAFDAAAEEGRKLAHSAIKAKIAERRLKQPDRKAHKAANKRVRRPTSPIADPIAASSLADFAAVPKSSAPVDVPQVAAAVRTVEPPQQNPPSPKTRGRPTKFTRAIRIAAVVYHVVPDKDWRHKEKVEEVLDALDVENERDPEENPLPPPSEWLTKRKWGNKWVDCKDYRSAIKVIEHALKTAKKAAEQLPKN